jgi:hypothetical protein
MLTRQNTGASSTFLRTNTFDSESHEKGIDVNSKKPDIPPGDIDLFAVREIEDSKDYQFTGDNRQLPKILIWKKLETTGYAPSAREVFVELYVCFVLHTHHFLGSCCCHHRKSSICFWWI